MSVKYQKDKYDYQVVRLLAHYRKRDKSLTQTQGKVGAYFGVGREAVADWENGRRKPRSTKRADFVIYLKDKLNLNQDEFRDLWHKVMEGQWGWEPLSDNEWEKVFPGRKAPTIQPPLDREPRNLHFVGREDLIEKVLANLRPGKVVTICGPAGIGKTDLVNEVIWRLAPDNNPPEQYPDGIIRHNFNDYPDTDVALENIIEAFKETPGRRPAITVQRILAKRSALLILDGAEDADRLPAILKVAGRCAVLVTSRKRDVTPRKWGDIWIDIPPLSLTEAVHLLRALGGKERTTDQALIEQICELVGCLPIAIQLVGRLLFFHQQPAEVCLESLQTLSLQTLDMGQQSEESVPLLLDHSLSQVGEDAQKALAVIGSLGLAPVKGTIIATALAIPPFQAERVLGELVNYGFLLHPQDHYKVSHKLIYTYAQEQLIKPAEIVDRIADYYITFTTEQSQEGPESFSKLDLERPHILAILSKLVSRNCWPETLRLVLSVEDYLNRRGSYKEYSTALEAGLKAAQALENRPYEGKFLQALGLVNSRVGWIERGIAYHEQGLAIAREIGSQDLEREILSGLGLAHRRAEQYDLAVDYHRHALAISQATGDRHAEAKELSRLGNTYYKLEMFTETILYLWPSLIISREIGNLDLEGYGWGDLGNILLQFSETELAIAYYEKALSIFKNRHRAGEGLMLKRLGDAYQQLEQREQALAYYKQALEICEEMDHPLGQADCWFYQGLVYQELNAYQQATDCLKRALKINQILDHQQNCGHHLLHLGLIEYAQGHNDQAKEYWQQSLQVYKTIQSDDVSLAQEWLEKLERGDATASFIKRREMNIDLVREKVLSAFRTFSQRLETEQAGALAIASL